MKKPAKQSKPANQNKQTPQPPKAPQPGVAARRLALDVLVRIDEAGAYANLALKNALDECELDERDRGLVTELVYGATRRRASLDFLIDRHLNGEVKARVRAALRIGTYQLGWTDVPDHAAVGVTVDATPKPPRGLVNAVLRKVAKDLREGPDSIAWPDDATRLSYPAWVLEALAARLGRDEALAMAAEMNKPATTHVRADGYTQDLASQAVVEAVEAGAGMRVLDSCAAPGGKATGLAGPDVFVVAGDRSMNRTRLITGNAARVDAAVSSYVGDGERLPFADGSFDRVLVDAPCSGFGVLRRRPDARWRVDRAGPVRLAELQRRLLDEAARVTAPGGRLVYSVCTLTLEENEAVAVHIDGAGLGMRRIRTETIVADAASDGMFLAVWERSDASTVI